MLHLCKKKCFQLKSARVDTSKKFEKNENWKLHAFFNAKLHIGFYQFLAFVSDLHWISRVESTVNPPKYQLGPFKWPLDGRITLWDIYNSISQSCFHCFPSSRGFAGRTVRPVLHGDSTTVLWWEPLLRHLIIPCRRLRFLNGQL